MYGVARLIALGTTLIFGGTGAAWSQPAMPGGASMGVPGAGAGMMGKGPGLGRGLTDPTSYLDALKSDLGITPAQEAAWNGYASTVRDVAAQMQGLHQTMYDAMDTATWQERRDMMNRMFEARQQAFDTVHEAAQKLLPSLTSTQRTRAAMSLPGLGVPGRGMMHRMPPAAAAGSS